MRLKVAYFDLETTNLNADIGRILCGTIRTHEGKVVTYRNSIPNIRKADDREIAIQIRDLLDQHHMLVGWHSKGFDVPFLNTRLVAHGERPLRRHLHLDPRWQMSGWRGLKPRSAKLKVAAEFFGLDEGKMELPVEVWAKAGVGDKDALKTLVERCESDVRLLYSVTQRILDTGLVTNIASYS